MVHKQRVVIAMVVIAAKIHRRYHGAFDEYRGYPTLQGALYLSHRGCCALEYSYRVVAPEGTRNTPHRC